MRCLPTWWGSGPSCPSHHLRPLPPLRPQDADLYGDVYTGIAPVHQQQHYVGGGSPALGGPPLLQQPPLALAEPFSGIAGSDGDVAVLRQQLAQTLADLQR